jgi:pimeloyl-ACP methyl ester carboxylesterase
MNQVDHSVLPASMLWLLGLLIAVHPALSQEAPAATESRFVEAGGVRVHYLDFGGEGLPVVFVHSESWDSHTYKDFALRFTDHSRVLAITRPGYGESEAHPDGFGVAAQARSLVDFLDALGIERAVFAGNSSPTVHLTYLAEHHPARVTGVIYLAGLLTPWLREVRDSDPAGAGLMATRASASDATARERREALFSYRPEFLAGDRPPIEVPALAFAGRSGTIGHERFSEPLALVGSSLMADFLAALPPSPFRDHFQRLIEDPAFRSESLRWIEDPEAREFLLRLADDPEMQAEVWRYQLEVAGPAVLAAQKRFARAFGDPLRIVRLDLPVVYGYEYRDSPEMIEPHIRRFLEEVRRREGRG